MTQFQKLGTLLNREFSEEETEMAEKNLKRCSKSLYIWET